MLSTFIAGSTLALAGTAYAQTTHEVATDGLAWSPNTLSDVASGDMVRVTFSTSIPHDIMSSTFDAPCTYNSDGGLASGVYQAGEVFVWTVNSTDPAFYFCSVGQHCQSGMILAINPTDTETQEAAVANAQGSTSQGPDSDAVVGGMLESANSTMGGSNSTTGSNNGTSETGGSENSTSSDGGNTTDGTTASDDEQGNAYGLRSSVAMVAAVVGFTVAFAL